MWHSNRKQVSILFPTNALVPNTRQSLLAGKDRRNGKTSAVQQYLAELEVDPVPEKENLEGAEAQHEGQDAGREETRRARGDLGPL